MRALDPAARTREFLRLWTRHEAGLKCTGTGIGRAGTPTEAEQPWIGELDLGDGAAGAVALERAPRSLVSPALVRLPSSLAGSTR